MMQLACASMLTPLHVSLISQEFQNKNMHVVNIVNSPDHFLRAGSDSSENGLAMRDCYTKMVTQDATIDLM